MKQDKTRFTRAALLSAAALLAAPAVAQQAAPVTPPPVVTIPAPAPVAPPSVVPTVDSDTSTNVTGGVSDVPGADKNSTTPINPAAAAAAEAEAAARRSAARPARRPASRPATARSVPSRPAPAPAAATPTPTPTPEATVPTPEPSVAPTDASVPVPAPAELAPAPVTADTATETQTTTTETGGSPLIWIILGVLVIAALAAFLLSRRGRSEPDTAREPVAVEPVAEPYVEPVAVAPVVAERVVEPEPFVPASQTETPTVAENTEPVDIAPAVAESASVEEPEAADIAALTAAAPAGDRPWLELAMRPVRAGTNVDEALVEIELTVANAGTVQAEDVRISTFMLPAGSDGELDRLLSQSRVDAAVEPLTIPAGEGTRVDATLALPRSELMANDATTFQPVVVADARYRLPDGGEGRTSASFVVGIASEGDLGLFELDRPVLREDVEARLYRDPARV